MKRFGLIGLICQRTSRCLWPGIVKVQVCDPEPVLKPLHYMAGHGLAYDLIQLAFVHVDASWL